MARPLNIDYEKHYPTKKDGDVIILKDLGLPPGGGNRNVLIRFLDTGNEQVAQLANVKNANVRDQAKHDIVGKIYPTTNSGDMRIINKLGIMGGTNTMYEVEFLNTGYKTIAALTNIESGSVKDPYAPVVHGIGYCGEIQNASSYYLYVKWFSMLGRSENRDGRHPTYKNIRVCDRWLFFGNFVIDCMGLPGYNDIFLYENVALDKDIFQLCLPPGVDKIYSPNTCCFIDGDLNSTCISNKAYDTFVANEHGIYKLNGLYYVRPYWFGQTWNFGCFTTLEAAVTIYNNRCSISNLPAEYYINTNIRCSNPSLYRSPGYMIKDLTEDIHAPFRNIKMLDR